MPQVLTLLFLLFSLIISPLSVSATNSNIYVTCSQLCFTPMTSYESNLNSLFSSLLDSASVCNFNNFTISPPGSSPSDDVIYGLFQCRGDLSYSDCRDCVANSLSQLKTTCPVSTGASIQLDGCYVKYDNAPFFGVEDKTEVLKRCGPSNEYYTSDASNRIDYALAYLIAQNGQYYRSGGSGSVQGAAQCIQDLTVSECADCFLEARGRLRSECATSAWGDMYLGKCYIRYADRDNDNDDADNDTCDYSDDDCLEREKKRKKRKRKIKMRQQQRLVTTVMATAGGVSSTAGLVVSGVYYYKNRGNRK